jgi:hypothetical protein
VECVQIGLIVRRGLPAREFAFDDEEFRGI